MEHKKGFIFIALFIISLNIFAGELAIEWACGDYPFAYYQTESGEVKGYLYDITIEALEKRMNIPVRISFFPWARCQAMVRKNEADMFLTIPTDERLIYTRTNETPVWIKKRLVYTYANHPKMEQINKINGLEDIKKGNYTVVSYIGNNWVESAVEGSGIRVIYSRTIEGMYLILAQERADLIIEDKSLVNPKIKEYKLTGKIVETDGIGSESAFHIMIGKESMFEGILEDLEEVIKTMWSDGTIKRILSEYNIFD